MPGKITNQTNFVAIKEAIQKKYFRFSIEQMRHLYHWINGKEESIEKPREYF
jgi:hypothetical protein